MQGKFIVFDGIDGSGKSTQFKLFCEKLREIGCDVKETREPTRELIGDLISKRLKKKTDLPSDVNGLIYTFLFYADRIEHNFFMKREIEKGKTVVSDRYYYSTLAYQRVQGLNTDFLLDLHEKLQKGYVMKPDTAFFIDVPAEEAMKRIDYRAKEKTKVEIFEHLEFLKKLRENYLKLKEILGDNIKIIDGMGTVKEVQERIWDKFDHL